MSRVVGETDDRYVPVEDGPSGRTNCQTRRGGHLEVDDRFGTIGTISRDQEEVI